MKTTQTNIATWCLCFPKLTSRCRHRPCSLATVRAAFSTSPKCRTSSLELETCWTLSWWLTIWSSRITSVWRWSRLVAPSNLAQLLPRLASLRHRVKISSSQTKISMMKGRWRESTSRVTNNRSATSFCTSCAPGWSTTCRRLSSNWPGSSPSHYRFISSKSRTRT